MGLAEPQNKTAVINALVNDIKNRNNALTAGDIGYRYVLQAWQNAGRSDVIFDMNSRDDVPGYGYQLKHGATALTESWQAYESVSNNHLMLGHLQEWFYAGLAGIQQTNNSVAYKNIVIKPQPVGDVTAVKAAFNSPYGQIVSDWKIVNGMFVLHVTIPANTTANIYLPGSNKIIKTGSGNYQYKIKVN
jgi:alpha-L-rhamnosidase